jgi:hypothetical protein
MQQPSLMTPVIALCNREGAEADVLRCFPFDAFRIRAVLIEVNKHSINALSLWFVRRGYTLEQIFLMSSPWIKRPRPEVLDHLYVRRPRAAVYPPGVYGNFALDDGAAGAKPPPIDTKQTCEKFSRHSGWYCGRWMHWLSLAMDRGARTWRACAAPEPKVPKRVRHAAPRPNGTFAH